MINKQLFQKFLSDLTHSKQMLVNKMSYESMHDQFKNTALAVSRNLLLFTVKMA